MTDTNAELANIHTALARIEAKLGHMRGEIDVVRDVCLELLEHAKHAEAARLKAEAAAGGGEPSELDEQLPPKPA